MSQNPEQVENTSKEVKNPKKQKTKQNDKITKKDIISFLLTIVIACAAAFLITRFVVCRTIVDGSSMQNTLQNNDNLITEMVSYYFRAPKRYEIVTLHPYEKNEKSFIKRIVGLPGETVQIVDGLLTINGEVMEDDIYGAEMMYGSGYDANGNRNLLTSQKWVLRENEFFVLGDNRNHSNDSRYIGPIQRKDIYGHAVLRFYPFNTFGVLSKIH